MRSFYDVPEAKRWAGNMTLNEANALPEGQVTETVADAKQRTVTGLYPGIAKVRVQPLADADLVFKVTVENLSSRRLRIHPSTIALELPSGERLSPVPVYAYGAARLPQDPAAQDRAAPLADIPGLEAVFAYTWPIIVLVAVLEELSSITAENKALDAHLETHRGEELREKRLSGGTATSGDVYFLAPAGTVPAEGSSFVLPIVDLDTATRYEVRLPIQAREGTAR
jgi:hypothetical protein